MTQLTPLQLNRRALALATLLAGSLALSACAPAMRGGETAGVAPEPRECFFTRNVNGFSAPDNETLYVRVGVRDVYQMQMLAPCPEMDWAQQLAIQSRSGSTICRGMDATIIAPSAIGPLRCQVRAVRKLTEPEAAALPPDRRP